MKINHYKEVGEKMLKQYEAIYKNGKLQWIDTPPEAIENRRVVVLLNEEREMPESLNISALLRKTRGTMGRHMTMEELDAEILTMRDEWTREWERN